MRRIRVIPTLLLQNGGLVKSVRFKNHKYVGDPINAVKIFNDKEVDELVVLDISATAQQRTPNIRQISEIASEAFMPVAYGGGITTIEQVKAILYEGVEKVVFNHSAIHKPTLLEAAAHQFGSSSVVVSIDIGKTLFRQFKVFGNSGTQNTKMDPVIFAKQVEGYGAGEIFLTSIERDGTYKGYDIELIKKVTAAVSIPVVACGGAGNLEDFYKAVAEGGASAVAAGSMFVYQRPHNAVLISYPSQTILESAVFAKI